GVAVETLSAFDHVAKISGTDIDVFEKSIRFLSKTMLDISRGTGIAKKTFKELGLSVTDSSGNLRDTISIVMEVADRIKNMTDETKKAAFASEIFGAKAGTQLLPMLKLGSEGIRELMGEAEDLNLIFSTEGAQAAADYTDAMTIFKGSIAGLTRELVIGLFPALTKIAEVLTIIIQKKDDLDKVFDILNTQIIGKGNILDYELFGGKGPFGGGISRGGGAGGGYGPQIRIPEAPLISIYFKKAAMAAELVINNIFVSLLQGIILSSASIIFFQSIIQILAIVSNLSFSSTSSIAILCPSLYSYRIFVH
ncbi:unnamed protein product, partial [marine sediment metagenome]